jgi:hypothetical protein
VAGDRSGVQKPISNHLPGVGNVVSVIGQNRTSLSAINGAGSLKKPETEHPDVGFETLNRPVHLSAL